MRLPRWFMGRMRHWKAVLWRPALKVGGLVWALLGALSVIRAETAWIPEPYRDLPIIKWLPSWSWTTWAMIGMALLVAAMFEGSLRVIDTLRVKKATSD